MNRAGGVRAKLSETLSGVTVRSLLTDRLPQGDT
jgi:hypothetical protein